MRPSLFDILWDWVSSRYDAKAFRLPADHIRIYRSERPDHANNIVLEIDVSETTVKASWWLHFKGGSSCKPNNRAILRAEDPNFFDDLESLIKKHMIEAMKV